MRPKLVLLLQRLIGWRLWVILSLATVLSTELIVSVMDLLLMGEVTADYLLTGLVAASIVAPPSLFLLSYLLQQLSRQEQETLSRTASHAEAVLTVALEELRTSEQKLLTILENVDACIYLKDPDGRYLFANRPARQLLQVEMEGIVGFGDEKFFDSATAANIRQNDRRVLESGDTLRAEEVNTISVSGRTVIYQSTKLPLRRDDGSIYALCGISTDVTARKQAELDLAEREAQLRTLIEAVPDSIQFKDGEGRWRVANAVCLRLFGLEGELWQGLSDAEIGIRHPHLAMALASCVASDEDAWRAAATYRTEEQILDGQSNTIHFDVIKVPLFDEKKSRRALVIIGRDITRRKQAEERLHLAASVFTHAREGIMITSADGTILDVNDAFARITSYERDEVLGRTPRILNSGRQETAFYATMWRDLIENGHWYGEVWNRRKNGEVYAAMQTISAVRDAQGNTQQYVALFSDITPLKEHERQLEHIAHYDALTALPNRVLLADRLHQAMAQAQRRGQRLAVAYLDLDGFKTVNDRHGHDTGDQLLMTLATRMKQALREGDTLARLGGDEFVAVMLDLANVAASVPMLARLLTAAAQPVPVGDLVLQVSASVGVTFYPQAGDVDADLLLRQSDQAMYQAKLAGKNRYHIFDAEQDRSVRGHHESLDRIRRALTEKEFVMYYQPKVNMRTGAVIGAEALIRWQHPEKGLLLPGVFLPVIEDHPLAVELGEWVIDTALTQMERWHAEGLDIPVSVNVGARQLQQEDFVSRLRAILAAHPNVRPGDLELEVLETSALEDLAQVSQVIEACRESGVSFSLDDFGTGYSSLTYLKRLSVTLLKIDRSFVSDMLDNPDDLAILEGVLGLSIAFRRGVIAEGVENVEHGEMLLQLGCELAQGYGIARPMPAHDLPGWSAVWRPDPAWTNLPPVSRDDLPLLFASVEHRAWIAGMKDYLKDQRDAPPPLDLHHCRFGNWLDAERLAGHDVQPAFHAIEPLHRQVHALAAELCDLHACGRKAKALARLDELYGLRDALLDHLKVLVRQGWRQTARDGEISVLTKPATNP